MIAARQAVGAARPAGLKYRVNLPFPVPIAARRGPAPQGSPHCETTFHTGLTIASLGAAASQFARHRHSAYSAGAGYQQCTALGPTQHSCHAALRQFRTGGATYASTGKRRTRRAWVVLSIAGVLLAGFGWLLQSIFAERADQQNLQCLALNVYYEARGESQSRPVRGGRSHHEPGRLGVLPRHGLRRGLPEALGLSAQALCRGVLVDRIESTGRPPRAGNGGAHGK